MSEMETSRLKDNLAYSLNLTFSRLLSEKKATDSELAFAVKGEVIKVKAVDLF